MLDYRQGRQVLIMRRQAGVSLIELMVGIALLSMLLAMGMPSINEWIQNSQLRTAAESIQNGLQLARAEAVRRNAQVRFQLPSAAGLSNWTVGCVAANPNCPAAIQVRNSEEGSTNARVRIGTTATAFGVVLAGLPPTNIDFNGFGRLTAPPPAGTSIRLDVINPAAANTRRLVLLISPGGQIRMCDPLLVLANNAQGCG
jgi:type IV fimbrial biogenesis protein FimT